MRRLHPEPAGQASLDELYVAPQRHRIGSRPWVGVCMIASLDGSTVVEGRSGGLSNPNDAAVFSALRRTADAVIVGASTARLERYGPPKKTGQRIGVVTLSGHVDLDADLFRSGAGFLIMPEDGVPTDGGSQHHVDVVRAGRGRVDLGEALARLDQVMPPPTFVQAEGGARLNGSLLDADCVDELDLTIASALAGGLGPRVTNHADATMAGYELAHLAVDEQSYLYSRWLRRPT